MILVCAEHSTPMLVSRTHSRYVLSKSGHNHWKLDFWQLRGMEVPNTAWLALRVFQLEDTFLNPSSPILSSLHNPARKPLWRVTVNQRPAPILLVSVSGWNRNAVYSYYTRHGSKKANSPQKYIIEFPDYMVQITNY